MHLASAKKLARTLLEKHGLVSQGWAFAFDFGKRRFGACHTCKKLITLSRHMVRLNEEAEVVKTMLHEIAHAFNPTEGHGPRWRASCVALGIAPSRCYDDSENGRSVVTVKPNFFYGHAGCDVRLGRFRRSRREVACSKCCRQFNGGRFDRRFLLVEVA